MMGFICQSAERVLGFILLGYIGGVVSTLLIIAFMRGASDREADES